MSFEDLLVDPTTTNAWQKLSGLAQSPFDLTADNALSPDRIGAMKSSAAGFVSMYATQRVTDEVLDTLQQLADETGAVRQYQAMLDGQRMNQIAGVPCENRQVLHTATRNVFADLICDHAAGQADAAGAASG